ncbi:MAG: hypothetical protein ACT4PT_03335 [Methanobacteriota archaeon]
MPATNETEAELVREYLESHVGPVWKEVCRVFQDPELRLLVLDKATRHIFHWMEDREMKAALAAAQVVARRNGNGDGGEDNGFVRADRIPMSEAAEREPATPKQLAYLRDRGVPHPADITKGGASRLITERIEGLVKA